MRTFRFNINGQDSTAVQTQTIACSMHLDPISNVGQNQGQAEDCSCYTQADCCCDTIIWTDDSGSAVTFTKGTSTNAGYPVYEINGQFMWWMWHGATGHWVINA